MSFVPFDLERWQSVWEHRVRYNLSESGVHPLTLAELLAMTDTDPETLHALRLGYSQTNGTDALREAVAALYEGAEPDQVLATVGGSEANFVTAWTLVGPDERAAVQLPNYLQTWGIARNTGADVATFALRFDRGWEPDPNEVRDAIRPDTKLVVVTNPNNPTGHVLSDEMRDVVLSCAGDVGAWVLVDEVYQGAEREGDTTASWWGRYDRLVISNGLSKAYGLPGLRLGWLVGPRSFIEEAEARHDYTVIGPSGFSDFMGVRVLQHRDRFLARTRDIVRDNYTVLDDWLRSFGDTFRWQAPDAGAICLAEYDLPVSSDELVERLRSHHDVLLVPGSHVGLSNHLRFGFGDPVPHLREGLEAVRAGLQELIPA